MHRRPFLRTSIMCDLLITAFIEMGRCASYNYLDL